MKIILASDSILYSKTVVFEKQLIYTDVVNETHTHTKSNLT